MAGYLTIGEIISGLSKLELRSDYQSDTRVLFYLPTAQPEPDRSLGPHGGYNHSYDVAGMELQLDHPEGPTVVVTLAFQEDF